MTEEKPCRLCGEVHQQLPSPLAQAVEAARGRADPVRDIPMMNKVARSLIDARHAGRGGVVVSGVRRYYAYTTSLNRYPCANMDAVVLASDYDALQRELDESRKRESDNAAMFHAREIALEQANRDRDAALARERGLREALEHFAAFPLEEFGLEKKTDEHPITGFNSWDLTVGHIRKARTTLRGGQS